jgi:cysteine desulfurase
MIYLDNNATTMVAPEVTQVMSDFSERYYSNPSSLYPEGKKVRRFIEDAREQMAGLLRISTRTLFFTSGATESNNTALHSALNSFPKKKRIVTSQVEHSSIKQPCDAFVQAGYEVSWVSVTKTGSLNIEALRHMLTDDVAVVSVMWANNETGVLFPIDEVARIVKEKGILLHVDAVQAVGKIPLSLEKVPVDLVSFSAHKIHGPKGIGALFVREGTPFHPLVLGGQQERGRRAGTENGAGIIGFAQALQLAVKHVSELNTRVRDLRDDLERSITQAIEGSFVNGESEPRIPNTTSITIPDVEAEPLLIRLGACGIAASSGSACLTSALEPSHVLQAMGHSKELASRVIRFSLSCYSAEDDIREAVKKLKLIVSDIRKLNNKSVTI